MLTPDSNTTRKLRKQISSAALLMNEELDNMVDLVSDLLQEAEDRGYEKGVREFVESAPGQLAGEATMIANLFLEMKRGDNR